MTVYTSYTYNQGGYGDFIRSIFAVFVYCKINNIEHKIYIPDHPLNKSIESVKEKLNYPVLKFVDNYHTNAPMLYELNKCNDKDYNTIIYSNQFDFIPFNVLELYKNEFKNFIKFTPEFKQRMITLKNQINNVEYVAIHIRCGDKFMECNSQCVNNYLINPNSERLLKIFEKTIEYLKQNYNLPICLFTDVKTLKDKLCKKYDVLSFDTEIHHVASSNNKENAFIDPIAEFELMGEAKAIVKLANSGYVYWTAFIHDVPLFKYNSKTDTIIPYIQLNYLDIFNECIE